MTFSIIVPTRNRPELLRRALASAVRQTCPAVEVVVVDDGSTPAMLAETETVVKQAGPRVRLHPLPDVPGGHGPALARNIGVSVAQHPYIGFLDDDDEWTDDAYLLRVAALLERAPFDLHMTDQVAVQAGQAMPGPIWIENLAPLLAGSASPEAPGTFRLTLDMFLQAAGFCHLNTLVVRREFFLGLGGFDATLRYESDRDFNLRAVDAAERLLYTPGVVGRHHVPDRTRRANVSTADTEMQRRLYQLRLLDKAILFSRQPAMRAYARAHKRYTLQKMALRLAEQGMVEQALFYGLEAAAARPDPRWLATLAGLAARRLFGR